jgi:putative two-component system response regulator
MELHTIRGRMTAGLLNKAQRGELALRLPVGLVRDERGHVSKDPNREIQARLELIFSTFLRLRSACKVLRFLNAERLLIPRRDSFGDLVWKKPTTAAILAILKNPAYAGAFAYGRSRTTRDPAGQVTTRGKLMSETKPALLIVDDVEASIDLLLETLAEDYTVRVAIDGNSALRSVQKAVPDIILLDVMMPDVDGFEVCRRLKADPAYHNVPIIFLTAMTGDADEARGLDLGAVDYISKPFSPAIVKARVRNHLELHAHRNRLEDLVKRRTSELERTQESIIASMALMAEYRDPETGGHIQRTKYYVRSLAESLAGEYPDDLTPTNIELLYQSAQLHDIGKVAISDAILLKPSELTPEEFAEMRRHPLIGSEIIRRAECSLGTNSFLRLAREIAEFHHERWDGSGYPHGLKGEAIPLCARLMSIADVYDAFVSQRLYKPLHSHGQAYDIIINGDGRTRPEHFSPVILKAFQVVHPEWERIAARFSDSADPTA